MKFFYGKLNYKHIIQAVQDVWKKKTYFPNSYDKLKEHFTSLRDGSFQTQDDVLKNTIALIQLSRYINLLEEPRGKYFEKEYKNIQFIMRGVTKDIMSLEDSFKTFFSKKILKKIIFLNKPPYYNGNLEPYEKNYPKDLDHLHKYGYAYSELWSVDYSIYNYMQRLLKLCIEKKINPKEDDKVRDVITFINILANGQDYLIIEKFLSKHPNTKKGKEKALQAYNKWYDDNWIKVGRVLPFLWN